MIREMGMPESGSRNKSGVFYYQGRAWDNGRSNTMERDMAVGVLVAK